MKSERILSKKTFDPFYWRVFRIITLSQFLFAFEKGILAMCKDDSKFRAITAFRSLNSLPRSNAGSNADLPLTHSFRRLRHKFEECAERGDTAY